MKLKLDKNILGFNKPRGVDMCAYALVQLEDTEDADVVTSFYIYLRNTLQQCIQLFVHFLVVKGI